MGSIEWPIIAIGIALLLIAVVAFMLRAWSESKAEVTDTGASKDPNTSKSPYLKWVTVVGVIVFVAALVAYMIFRGEGEGGSDGDGAPIAAFIPIWFAALVPIIVAKKKKREGKSLDKSQRGLVWVILALVLALIVATLIFTLR